MGDAGEHGELAGAPRRINCEHPAFAYDAATPPCARVAAGQTIVVETRNALAALGLEPGDELVGIDLARCDPLTGPIHVDGLEPGDTLAVHVEDIALRGPALQGVMAGFGTLERPATALHAFAPRPDGTLPWLHGIELRARPSIGAMGVAPRTGAIPSIEPGDHGGNQDARHLRPGATLELPVFHPGARLYVGDCHALQGDGELSGVALEVDAEVTLRLERLDGPALSRPRILTADRVAWLASAPTLEAAVRLATADVVDRLSADTTLTDEEAYLLLSLEADVEICQVVDPLMTVRVAIRRELVERLAATHGRS